MILITFGIFLLFFVSWYHLKYGHRNKLLAKIPAPRRWPLIHHIPEFIGKSPLDLFNWFEKTKEKLGQVYVITFEPFDDGSVIVSNPNVAEAILTSSKHLRKSVDYDMMTNWLGDGLLISTGNKWRQRRKVLTSAFHFQILDKFMDVMNDHGNVLVEKLKKLDEVDIYHQINLYALDVICESAMGCKISAQNVDSDYVKAVKE
jgi:cytochrome P450 family 4